MPTSAPARVIIGDIRRLSLTSYNNQIISVCRMATEQIALHFDGDAEEKLLFLPFREPKDVVGAAVIGDILYLLWDGVGQNITLARWNLLDDEVDLAPQVAFTGSVPSLQAYLGGGLLAHFIDLGGDHVSRKSTDGGLTWEAPVVIDPRVSGQEPVEHADVSISPLTPVTATWADSKPHLIFNESYEYDEGWSGTLPTPNPDFNSPTDSFNESYEFLEGWPGTIKNSAPDFSNPDFSFNESYENAEGWPGTVP